ncbi:MAG TPA: HEAT repeat domain-containing protein [Kofleriaceae bacterium]|nr:HEAT repeat domain-containing protein [Kofleriaceae bacterium]
MTVEDARKALVETGATTLVPLPKPELDRACGAIRELGKAGDVDSAGTLARLLESHPDRRLRVAAAHALAGIDDERAHTALDARWDDKDNTIATVAVRAAVFRDLPTVWTRFRAPVQAVLDRRSDTPGEERVVAMLLYACHGGTHPRRIEPSADPLVVEPRLVDLAARLRRHDVIGDTARRVLSVVPRDEAIAAIERYPYDPVLPRVPLPERRDFLARYLAGERGVWNELVEQAVAVVQHAELRDEAHAVAVEIMKRVRHNTDVLRGVLREAGAELEREDAPAGDADLAKLASSVGPIPIALDAFWRVAGSISLTPGGANRYSYGACALESEGLSLIALDPLEVWGARAQTHALASYEDEIARSHPEIVGPFCAELSRDFLHKQDISGGPPYSIEMPPPSPADAVDPRVYFARHRLRFVEYLRHCLRWGGFCILEVAHRPIEHVDLNDRIAFQRVTGDWGEAAARLLARLRADLVDF